MIVDIGRRSFLILLEDSGIPSLRSKISQVNTKSLKPAEIKEATAISKTSLSGPAPPLDHYISLNIHSVLKGKAPACVSPSIDNFGKHVEHGSMLGQSMN